MLIDINKKYKTVDNKTVRVLCTDLKVTEHYPYPVLVAVTQDYAPNNGSEEILVRLTSDGRANHLDPKPYLTEIDGWRSVKTDTPILVNTEVRHFAGYENGVVYFFTKGTTSQTYTTISTAPESQCKELK